MIALIFQKKSYIFFALLLLLIAGIFLFRFSKGQPRETTSFPRYITEKCEKDAIEGHNICLYETLGEIASTEGISEAQNVLWGLYERNIVELGECHDIAHTIGDIALSTVGVERAFQLGTPMCHWGYVHGIFQKLQRIENLDALALAQKGGRICREFSSSEFTLDNIGTCFHGLGHGLAAFSVKDLITPLRACDEAAEEEEYLRECYAGVFMELARPNSRGPSYFYKAEDPFYPCDILPDEYLKPCYVEIPQRAIPAGFSFAEILFFCGQVPDRDVASICRNQVYGSIAYGPYDMQERYDRCRTLAPESQKECIEVVAVNLKGNPVDFGQDAVEQFCRVVQVGEKLSLCQKNNI